MKILSHKIEELSSLKYNTLVTVECDFCHKHFQKLRKTIGINLKRGSKHLFCNGKCLAGFHHKQSSVSCQCLRCGGIFERNRGNIKSSKTFCSLKCSSEYNSKLRIKKGKPVKIPRVRHTQITCICTCGQCNKEINRSRNDLSKSHNKNGLIFCSRSCRMTHQNLNNPKKYGCRKSKAETYLCNLIRTDFPNLTLTENDRTILKSKLEIDIFIKEFKLAIELNGPVHYFPIYGEDRLKKCQNRDLLKQQEICNLGLAMIIIDISRLNSKKRTEQFLNEYYASHIKPLIS